MIRTDTPALDRDAIRQRVAHLYASLPDVRSRPDDLDRPEGRLLLLALASAGDVPPLLDALHEADLGAAREAETAVHLQRRIASALLLIDRADGDPARAATLRHDLRVAVQSSQDVIEADGDRRRVQNALAAIGPVDVGVLPGQAGDLLRKVHAALTGARDGAGVQA